MSDKYLYIGHQLFDMVQHQPSKEVSCVPPREIYSEKPSPEISKLIQELVARGILVTDSEIGKEIEPTVAAPSATSTLSDPPAHRTSIWMLRVPIFFSACRRAARELALNPLHLIVQEVKGRRLQVKNSRSTLDLVKTRTLIGDFEALRYIFPRKYLCLFDSLALIHFLAAYSQFPAWVFGVDAEPFSAHCWLQEGSVVLNDTLPNVSRYTPIMAV